MSEIFEAISKVMDDVGAVGKDGHNDQGKGYKYRSIDAVMNALHPAMVKHGVFCTPEVIEHTREERVSNSGSNLIYSVIKVKYTFFAKDGSSVTTSVIGEGFDSGDKSSNKAMSAAFKYACFQTFCIPTDEMVDSETESHEVRSKEETPQSDPDAWKREPASEPQKNAIRAICKKRGIELEGLYSQWKTSENKLTKYGATVIINELKKGE